MAQSRDLKVQALTASTTQTEANTAILNGDIIALTVSNASDSVKIPPDLPVGTIIHVVNLSANAGKVYPPTGGSINGGTATTGSVAIAASISLLIYVTASGAASTYSAFKTAAL
jgi:hypothetical protein